MLRRLRQAWDEMVMNGQNGKKKLRVALCDITDGPKPLVPPPETP